MITLWNIVLVGIVLFISLKFFGRKKLGRTPPGPWPLPVFGNAFSFAKGMHIVCTKWSKEYGKIYQMFMLSSRTIILSDVELAKKAYQLPGLQGRPRIEMMERDGVRHGIMLTSGQEWQEQRRFTLRHLRDFGFGKNYMEGLILDEVDEVIEWIKSNEGKPISINRKFYLAVINSLWTILGGKRFSHDDPQLGRVFDLLVTSGKTINPVFVMFMPRLAKMFPNISGWNKIQALMAESTYNIITSPVTEHLKEFTQDRKENPRDFIDAYLGEIERTTDTSSTFYGKLGEKSLEDVALDLFQAGSMTTSTMLAWVVLYNVVYPEAQAKLHKEIDEVIGKNRASSIADKPKMIYTEALTSEILRKTSFVPIGGYHLATEDIAFEGYDIPKGAVVGANFYHIHNNPEVWGDPENFRPERFITSEGKFQNKDLMIPFGTGKRVCLGETLARDEIFLFMTSLFQRFEMRADPDRPKPSLDPVPVFDLLEAQEFFITAKDRRD